MLAIAIRNFKVNNYDVKKRDIFEIEDGYVIVNDQFFCSVGSPNFKYYFELVE